MDGGGRETRARRAGCRSQAGLETMDCRDPPPMAPRTPSRDDLPSAPDSAWMGGVTLLDALAEQPATAAPAAPGPASPFDACHGGVVWRVLVFVHGVTAIALLFVAAGLGDWLVRLALAATWVLPATLAWLVTACLGRRAFDRLPGGANCRPPSGRTSSSTRSTARSRSCRWTPRGPRPCSKTWPNSYAARCAA